MDQEWVAPGPGFSEDWLGFRRSASKRASGRHYAQCKYCGTILDGRLPGLRKHKINCEMFGTANEIEASSEAYYESGENEESNEDEGQHHHEYVDALPQIHIKAEPPSKRKKLVLARKSAPHPRVISHIHHQPSVRIAKPESPPTSYEFITPASTPRSLPKSRFADAARVWERKLEDLPFSQALQIEKSINDLLYEASLANAQDMHQPAPVIKVNIASQHLEHNE